MNIQKSSLNTQKISFSGHKKALDKTGYPKHDFCYLYDTEKYDCVLELYNIAKEKKTGNIVLKDNDGPAATYDMKDGKISLDFFYVPEIYSEEGFAYRFKLTDKTTKETSYAFDNGMVIGMFDKKSPDKYNVVLDNRAIINKNGPMQLIMPDEYYPGIENKDGKPYYNDSLRSSVLSSVRTHANKLGGNFYGIIERLPEIEKEGVKRIVGTPFTKDPISSHLYWTCNAYQTAPNLGSEEDFIILQQELFKHGINWIADAALVNEGFGGIHMSELLRKGDNSFSKNMFRSDEKISLGILPDKCANTRMKIINAPFIIKRDGTYIKNNPDYTPSKPTYIQFYDARLASEEQKNSDSPKSMMTYKFKNTDNIYDITTHDDAVYPFAIEVDPYELERNVKKVAKEGEKIYLANTETIKKIADFSNFQVVNKSEAGGLELWDGNVDIAKLNFYYNDKDYLRFSKLPEYKRKEAIADFKRGALAVRDYAVNSGKYWTKFSADAQFDYIVSSLKGIAQTSEEYMEVLKSLVDFDIFPESVLENIDEEVIENVLIGDYRLRRLDDADMRAADINPEGWDNQYTVQDYILRQAMDVPLETLPFGTNLLGIITSPYIAKKANKENELGVSRYDLTKADNPNLPEKYKKVYSQVDDLYENEITPLIYDVVKDIPGISEDGMVTDYGKYIISKTAPELTKYILTKAVAPEADIIIESDGHINLSNVDDEKINMQSFGIPYSGKTLEEESQIVVNAIRQGISKLNDKDFTLIKQRLQKKYENCSLNDFKVAEMILDRTESGLGWRIDAAKDIASIDSVRSNYLDMDDEWDKVIDFWNLYNSSVLEINPHAYTTAELTDLDQLMDKQTAENKYVSAADAERKFLQETGITSIANYSYFFSLLPDLFCITYPSSEIDNYNCWMGKENKNNLLRNKLDKGWNDNPGFLFQSPEDGIVNSYTFVGNHDKPRILHTLGLDMGLFYSDFSTQKHQKIALEVLQSDKSKVDFDEVDSKSIAMGSRLNTAFDDVIKEKNLKEQLKATVAELINEQIEDKNFTSDLFGTMPFEKVIENVFDCYESKNGKIPNRKKLEAETLKSILLPAFNRFYSIYKLLMVLPGSPTDFAGDKIASSGYETKAKNYYQQNRNIIHWEWLNDDDKYGFVKTFYDNMNEIAALRKNKNLSALNDGATVTIPILEEKKIKDEGGKVVQKDVMQSEYIQAILRYNDSGSVVLTLHDSSGSDTDFDKIPKRKKTEIGNIGKEDAPDEKTVIRHDKLFLNIDSNNFKQGLKHGLTPGTKFKNVSDGDDSIYTIAKMQKNGKDYYYLKRQNTRGQELPIQFNPDTDYNTMILYKV